MTDLINLNAWERSTDVILRAEIVACGLHEGQKRKYTGERYIVHCEAVAKLVKERGGDNFMQAAAWLHDTIEDTPATEVNLRVWFQSDVVDLVVGLTDVYTKAKFPSLNRAARKALEVQRYAGESSSVQLIKVCDMIDNTKSIIEHDPAFAILYLREKADLLSVFRYSVLNTPTRKTI